MKLIAFIQMFNEVEKGNLERCLINCKKWSDDIVIYDDASTDDSVKLGQKYTNHILRGSKNEISRELYHKQELLDYAIKNISPTHIMWIDCDEILDRSGTKDAMVDLCNVMDKNDLDCMAFHELNLWRGQNWCRTDSLFDIGWFNRLWKVRDNITFQCEVGVHKRIYPITISDNKIQRSNIRVIHYGFYNYEKMLIKIGVKQIGANQGIVNDWQRVLIDIYTENWILNETELNVYEVPESIFPEENIPKERTSKPVPFTYKTVEDVERYANNYNWDKHGF